MIQLRSLRTIVILELFKQENIFLTIKIIEKICAGFFWKSSFIYAAKFKNQYIIFWNKKWYIDFEIINNSNYLQARKLQKKNIVLLPLILQPGGGYLLNSKAVQI